MFAAARTCVRSADESLRISSEALLEEIQLELLAPEDPLTVGDIGRKRCDQNCHQFPKIHLMPDLIKRHT